MYVDVTITGYSYVEGQGMWVHFKDGFQRARHCKLGNIQLVTVDGRTHIMEV